MDMSMGDRRDANRDHRLAELARRLLNLERLFYGECSFCHAPTCEVYTDAQGNTHCASCDSEIRPPAAPLPERLADIERRLDDAKVTLAEVDHAMPQCPRCGERRRIIVCDDDRVMHCLACGAVIDTSGDEPVVMPDPERKVALVDILPDAPGTQPCH